MWIAIFFTNIEITLLCTMFFFSLYKLKWVLVHNYFYSKNCKISKYVNNTDRAEQHKDSLTRGLYYFWGLIKWVTGYIVASDANAGHSFSLRQKRPHRSELSIKYCPTSMYPTMSLWDIVSMQHIEYRKKRHWETGSYVGVNWDLLF